MRDMRDPAVLGHLYLAARGRGETIEHAVKSMAPSVPEGPSCIEKYGSANDVEDKYMVVKVK